MPNHYATLGLDQNCTTEQIRAAYRLLAKQLHPDLNSGLHAAVHTQELNAAWEVLGDAERRSAYDSDLADAAKTNRRTTKISRNVSHEVYLRLEEFFRGTTREVRIHDPGNSGGVEIYHLLVPPQTVPGTRLRLPRNEGGFVIIRVRPLPHFQFKARGSNLRCDLKINWKLAAQGGEKMIKTVPGQMLRVKIPPRIERGEIICISNEGLPKQRGGRGDLLVKILYQPEVRVTSYGRS
ncbi:MAG: DnaJ C-terminal domain-containing protein [Verrucomicrobiota bacterium]